MDTLLIGTNPKWTLNLSHHYPLLCDVNYIYIFLCSLQEEGSGLYTGDGSVDLNGKPVLKQNTGNWKACPFILGVLLFLSCSHALNKLFVWNYCLRWPSQGFLYFWPYHGFERMFKKLFTFVTSTNLAKALVNLTTNGCWRTETPCYTLKNKCLTMIITLKHVFKWDLFLSTCLDLSVSLLRVKNRKQWARGS